MQVKFFVNYIYCAPAQHRRLPSKDVGRHILRLARKRTFMRRPLAGPACF